MIVTKQLAPGRLAPGRRVYVIGDVHGCADRLFDLHAVIAEHLAADPCTAPLLLHLGDLVDRGPDSARVVARLSIGSPVRRVPMINLMGNHEWMMLKALSITDPGAAEHWMANGGGESLRSWGVKPGTPPRQWPGQLPTEHLLFLRDLRPYHQLDGYLFVHAGVRPGIPLAQQHWSDLLWIREGFLDYPGALLPEAPALAAVHGHTPVAAPELRPNRIGLDTGAVRGGKLTCAVLEDDQVAFLQS